MSSFIADMYLNMQIICGDELALVIALFFPFVVAIEMPLYLLIIMAYMRRFFEETHCSRTRSSYCPSVSCILTCYSEGKAIYATLRSIGEQIYRGDIETIVVIDGADVNKETLDTANKYANEHSMEFGRKGRSIKIVPKSQRGGRVSSNNLGMSMAKGEIIIIIDGDCTLDNDLVACAVKGFEDPNVMASSGNIRVRNASENLLTRLQALEYMLGLQLSKTGLAELGMLNNISGAHGIFRRSLVESIGGWKNGTAEDLDMTMRLKGCLKRYPGLKLIHSHDAVMHTDVPDTLPALVRQRIRWDGDISFLYFRRFSKLLRPKMLGWRNVFSAFWYDLMFCLGVPFLSTIYLIWVLVEYPLAMVAALLSITYLYYLLVAVFMFVLYLAFVSERKRRDLSFAWCIPMMPIYQFFMRFVTAFATLAELALSTHKDTSMAPWWVIRKTH